MLNFRVRSAEYLSDTNTSTYAVPDMIPPKYPYYNSHPPLGVGTQSRSSTFLPLLQNQRDSMVGGDVAPLIPLHPRVLFTGPDALSLEGSCGNSVYALPPDVEDAMWSGEVEEWPREALQFVRKLGQGPCGEVIFIFVLRFFSFCLLYRFDYFIKPSLT